MVEVNCLTHQAPHARGGRCTIWVATYDEAYRRAGRGDLNRYYEHLPDGFEGPGEDHGAKVFDRRN